jgi:hypothetical protein
MDGDFVGLVLSFSFVETKQTELLPSMLYRLTANPRTLISREIAWTNASVVAKMSLLANFWIRTRS